MSSRENNIEIIRLAVIKANPEIETERGVWHQPDGYDKVQKGRPIRLADVLLAIKPRLTNTDYDNDKDRKAIDFWNLRQDDLTQQSPECILFLYELLK